MKWFLKFSLLIGLVVAGAYFTGNWDSLMQLVRAGLFHLEDLVEYIKSLTKSIT
jgi:hypothetical protein